MTAPVKVGVLLPTREQAMTGRYDGRALVDLARRAEALGFDSVWAGDSVLARPRLDPLVVLAAVAAATTRITVGTAAWTAILRPPAVAAQLLATLAQVSGGRFVAGVGSGFPVPETAAEFDTLGVPRDRRPARLDDALALWRRTWVSGCLDVDGPPASGELARPPSGSPLPVWLAGSGTPGVLRRVADHYDGWLPFLPTAADYARASGELAERLTANGRGPDAVTTAVYATVTVDPDASAARRELDGYLRGYYGRDLDTMAAIQAYGWGPAERCAQWLSGYVDAGARHLVLRIGSLHAPRQLELIAEHVLPAIESYATDAITPPIPAPPTLTPPIPAEGAVT